MYHLNYLQLTFLYEMRKFVRNYSEGTLRQIFFGYKSKFIKKMSLKFGPCKKREKKVIIHFFLGTKCKVREKF